VVSTVVSTRVGLLFYPVIGQLGQSGNFA